MTSVDPEKGISESPSVDGSVVDAGKRFVDPRWVAIHNAVEHGKRDAQLLDGRAFKESWWDNTLAMLDELEAESHGWRIAAEDGLRYLREATQDTADRLTAATSKGADDKEVLGGDRFAVARVEDGDRWWFACEKCSFGVMDTTNPHYLKTCTCECHTSAQEAAHTPPTPEVVSYSTLAQRAEDFLSVPPAGSSVARQPKESSDHPHGPADPRWIDDEGRCVLCGFTYWKAEGERLVMALAVADERVRRLERLAKNAKSLSAAPDYDEEAIKEALWLLVTAVLEGTDKEPSSDTTAGQS